MGASSVSILLASITKETRGSAPDVGLSVGGSVGTKRHLLWVAFLSYTHQERQSKGDGKDKHENNVPVASKSLKLV